MPKRGLLLYLNFKRMHKDTDLLKQAKDAVFRHNPNTPLHQQDVEEDVLQAARAMQKGLLYCPDSKLFRPADLVYRMKLILTAFREIGRKRGISIVPIQNTSFTNDLLDIVREQIRENFINGHFVPGLHPITSTFFKSVALGRDPLQNISWPWDETFIGAVDYNVLPCDAKEEYRGHGGNLPHLRVHPTFGGRQPVKVAARFDLDFLIPESSALTVLRRPSDILQLLLHQRNEDNGHCMSFLGEQDFDFVHVGPAKYGPAARICGWQHVWFASRYFRSLMMEEWEGSTAGFVRDDRSSITNLHDLFLWKPQPPPMETNLVNDILDIQARWRTHEKRGWNLHLDPSHRMLQNFYREYLAQRSL